MTAKYETNKKIRAFMEEGDKKACRVADKAGMRRDLFSRILNMKRPLYADEILPISKALGITVEELLNRQVEQDHT